MFAKYLICAVLAGVFLLGSRSLAGGLVEGSDPRAKPMKEALAVLVKEIGGGDFEKAKSAYAGTGADLDVLKAYVDGVAAAKAMRAAMQAKFGDQVKDLPGLDDAVARMAVNDFNSVIFLDEPDRAASSADSPLGVGIEFKRVDGKWKVLSLVSGPNIAEDHLARLKKYVSTVSAITGKVKSGGYRSADDALDAADEAERALWPRTK